MWSSFAVPLMPAKAGIQFFTCGPGSPLSRGRADGEARVSSLKRLGAGDDLDQLLGDHRLARAVIGERLLADHLAGVSRRVVHRAHARALLGRGVLQECAEDLYREIARQQLGQDLVLLRLV